MDINYIVSTCTNILREKHQSSYCIVKTTDENIEKINKVFLFFDSRVIKNKDALKTHDVLYLFLGGGVKYSFDEITIRSCHYIEVNLDTLIYEISKCRNYDL